MCCFQIEPYLIILNISVMVPKMHWHNVCNIMWLKHDYQMKFMRVWGQEGRSSEPNLLVE